MRASGSGIVLFALVAGVAESKPPSPSNPLIGSWQLTVEGGSCIET